jgi:tripartite-type tricarboxylate transporter receptor subunit TctC
VKQIILTFLTLLLGTAQAAAQTAFFQGKTIRIAVGYLSGDTHDLWARAYARNLGKHVLGNPEIIVQNMPGAGSMIAANYVYNVAKPDGLTLGSIAPGLYLAQLTGNKEVKFDWARYTWIGTPEHNGTLLFMRSDAPYKSIEDIRKAKEPPKCSATGVGTSGHLIPRLLEETLNLKFQLVTGYPGGAEQDLTWNAAKFNAERSRLRPFSDASPSSVGTRRALYAFLFRPRASATQASRKFPHSGSLWRKKKHRIRIVA